MVNKLILIRIIALQYHKLLQLEQTKIDVVQFICFSIKQKFIQLNQKEPITKSNEQKMKQKQSKQVDQALSQQQKKCIIFIKEYLIKILNYEYIMASPYQISSYFSSQNNNIEISLLQLHKSNRIKQLQIKINSIIDNLQKKAGEKYTQKFNKFLNNSSTQQIQKIKKYMILMLLYQARQKIMKKQKFLQNKNTIQNLLKKPQPYLSLLKIDQTNNIIPPSLQSKNQNLKRQQIIKEKEKQQKQLIQYLEKPLEIKINHYSPQQNKIQELQDEKIFSYEVHNKYQCCIHQNIIVKLLKKQQLNLLLSVLTMTHLYHKLISNQVAKGFYFKLLIIQLLKIPGTNIKYQFIQSFNNEKQIKVQKNVSPLSGKIYSFVQIPKKYQQHKKNYYNFKFFESIQKVISDNKLISINNSFLLLPGYYNNGSQMKKLQQRQVKQNMKTNQQFKINNQLQTAIQTQQPFYSKQSNNLLIDQIIIDQLRSSCQVNIIKEITDKPNYVQKMFQFLIQFMNFKDKFLEKITIHNISMPLQLGYYVIVPFKIKQNINWKKKLQQYIKKLQLELMNVADLKESQRISEAIKQMKNIQIQKQNTNFFKIKRNASNSLDKKQFTLKILGVLTVNKNFKITNNDNNMNNNFYFLSYKLTQFINQF